MSDAKDSFAIWQKLIGNEDDPWESMDDAMFLFEMLPATGAGLEVICAGHAHGDEILARLKEFYADAGVDQDGETVFESQRVPKKSDEEIQALLLQHAANIREMAVLCAEDPENDVMVKCAGNPPKLVRVKTRDEMKENQDIQVLYASDLPWMFEEVSKPDSSNHLLELTEALYHCAMNSYAVENYVLWPARKGESTLKDPYRPGYELWLQGVEFRYADEGLIHYTVETE